MNQDTAEDITHLGAKISLVWASIGITSWTDAASFLAFILSALALTEYTIKKIAIPFGEYMGWLKPRKKKVHLVEVADD